MPKYNIILERNKAIDPTKIETQSKNSPEEDLEEALGSLFQIQAQGESDPLTNRGIIFLDDVINKQSIAGILKQLWAFHFDENFTDTVQLIINSPGGYVDAGWALVDTMESVRYKIRTVALGQIASMATMVFVAGDERIMSPNSLAMIHHFSGSFSGSYRDLLANRKMEDIMYKRTIKHFVKYSKYNTEKEILNKLLKDQDFWLMPQEMKKHGMCDVVCEKKGKKIDLGLGKKLHGKKNK